LNTVVIDQNYRMKFNFVWTFYFNARVVKEIKPWEVNNLSLIDNLNNEYHFLQAGGCAAKETLIFSHNPGEGNADCGGWFIFPPAKLDATSFKIIDIKNHLAIENIMMVKDDRKTAE
jgi:hypothetical protein